MSRDFKIFLFIIFITLVIVFFIYPMIRYEKASLGIFDIKYDRFKGEVYVRNVLLPDPKWEKTIFKNMREAKFFLKGLERDLGR